MEKRYRCMEDSLRRTSALGRDVLERAGRRDQGWWSSYRHEGLLHGTETPEDTLPLTAVLHPPYNSNEYCDFVQEEEQKVTLEEAFTTLSHFMCRTTEQCQRYHSCLPLWATDERGKQHALRFHSRKSQPMTLRPDSRLSSSAAPPQSGPRDVCMEVAPGTYSISGGSRNCQTQTHVVNITLGQSVDLTFNV
ncbi:A-kinase-interacting protein 1 isoform X2 [Mixophyes fleayi]